MRSPEPRAPRPAKSRVLGVEPLERRCLLSRMGAPPLSAPDPGGAPVESSPAWGWTPGGDSRSGYAAGEPLHGSPSVPAPVEDAHRGPLDFQQGGGLPWGGGRWGETTWTEIVWTPSAAPPISAGAGIHPDFHPKDSAPVQPSDPSGTSPVPPPIQNVLTVPDVHPFSNAIAPAIRAAGAELSSLAVSVGPTVHETLPASVLAIVSIQAPQAVGVVLAAAPWPGVAGGASGLAAGVVTVARAASPVPTAQNPRGAAVPETRGGIPGMASASPWDLAERGLNAETDYGAGWQSTELALAASGPQRPVIQANPDDPVEHVAERVFRLPMPDPQGDGPITHFTMPGRATLEAAIDRFLGHVDATRSGRGDSGEPVRWVPASLALMAVVLASDAIQRFAHRSPDDEELKHEPRGADGDGDASLARFPGLPGPWSLDET